MDVKIGNNDVDYDVSTTSPTPHILYPISYILDFEVWKEDVMKSKTPHFPPRFVSAASCQEGAPKCPRAAHQEALNPKP
jgi:hypothetical protein